MNESSDVNDLQLEDVEDYVADYPADGKFPQSENLHTQDAAIDSSAYRRNKAMNLLRANKWFIAAVAVVTIVIAVIVGVALGGKTRRPSAGDAGPNTSEDLITIDPDQLDPTITGPLMDMLVNTYKRHGLDASSLDKDKGETPQRLAFYWLATDNNLDNLDHTQKTQRFALATLYYSTNRVATSYASKPTPWTSAHLWLSKAHVCEWKGIVCNSQHHVQSIDLERNNLTGSLPKELAMLADHLTTLDLTSNLLYLEGDAFDIFEPLVNLETLLLDDNFLVTNDGLPWKMKALKKLKKLRLSYNLLAGEMEKDHVVLGHMPKLTHLEIESNFLTGNMPSALLEMTNLIYLYMRRNELSFNLDFLKEGRLPELFALWLDNNKITGTIPTEIGLMTELASVSITNATLTGTIPTEMGHLSKLRRLWLYSNKLDGEIPDEFSKLTKLEVFEVHHNDLGGSMPDGVCKSVSNSGYAYRSLTSDCKTEVTCGQNCCTECFD